MELVIRSFVGEDGTLHLVTRTASYWEAFDDPERPLGATGVVTADCGVVLRRRDAEAAQECPFCRTHQGRGAGHAA